MALFHKRDGMFLYWTVVIMLVVMGFMFEVKKKMQPSPASAQQVMAMLDDLRIISTEELKPKLMNNEQKPTLVFVYASWCTFCRQVMPNIIDLKRSSKLEHINLLMLSIDSSPDALARYLADGRYKGLFTPYLVTGTRELSLKALLQNAGSSYEGGIPFILVFDADGRLLNETFGYTSGGQILSMTRQ